jgi:ABC-type enterochelin transport system permease subunit
METLRLVLLFIHILGFAALLGGLLVQVREQTKSVNPLMRDGSGTAFLAGLLLVGVLEAGDGSVDHTKIAVKFVVALVILVLVMANMRKPSIPQGLYYTLLGLTLLNIAVAVFWSPAHA